jgi:hypothetical protein
MSEPAKAIPVGVDQDGAVDESECRHVGPRWPYCLCGRCEVCGEHKHMAVHLPLFGQPPGSRPWGHRFVPRDEVTPC